MKTWDEVIAELSPEQQYEAQEIRDIARMVSTIIKARKALGWTQEQLAERAKMKQSQVARFENGSNPPNIKTIQRLASAVGLRFGLFPADQESFINHEAAATSSAERELEHA